jgi:hypothetical protein
MKLTILALLIAVSSVGTVQGQAVADTVKHRNDCRLAEQVYVTGHPEPKTEWAHDVMPTCGFDRWARAVSAELRRLRTSSDTARLERTWFRIRTLRDTAVFTAALDIAADHEASIQARLYALAELAWLKEPRYDTKPADLVVSFDSAHRARRICKGGMLAGGSFFYPAAPLPVDWKERIIALGSRLAGNPQEAPEIRSAATCLTIHIL